jgi:hypothetical protein
MAVVRTRVWWRMSPPTRVAAPTSLMALGLPHPGRVLLGARQEEVVLRQAEALGDPAPGQGLPFQVGGVDQNGVHVLPFRQPQGLPRAHGQHLDRVGEGARSRSRSPESYTLVVVASLRA